MISKDQQTAKLHLQQALRALLVNGQASSQEDICLQLTNQGFEVNQSKISRLLHKLGAIKTKNEQGLISYGLPKETALPSSLSPLSELVMDITHNESCIVIHTSPGSASLIARILDHNQQDSAILGSIAGDDTIFVAPKSLYHLDKTLAQIQNLLAMAI